MSHQPERKQRKAVGPDITLKCMQSRISDDLDAFLTAYVGDRTESTSFSARYLADLFLVGAGEKTTSHAALKARIGVRTAISWWFRLHGFVRWSGEKSPVWTRPTGEGTSLAIGGGGDHAACTLP